MPSMPATVDPSDLQFVALARKGDREAYGRLVARHQTLVVSLAYSICGDFARSEDIAQDAFVAAWRQLASLEDDAKFKSWVAGIARNLALNAIRQRGRRPDQLAGADLTAPEAADDTPGPREQAATREEAFLVWQTLEKLPETYREPLILFYRERQSVERVAAALDLSEDTVKQRLSRGRAMMRDNVERVIERSLGFTTPGALFTVTVLGLLPAVGVQLAAASASGATVAKGVSAKGAASLSGLTFAGMVAAPLMGLAVLAVALRDSLRNFTHTSSDRLFLKRLYGATALFMVLCGTVPILLVWRRSPSGGSSVPMGALLAWFLLLLLFGLGVCLWARRPFIAWGRTIRLPADAPPLRRKFWFGPDRALAYRSRLTLLGLPLLDIRFGYSPEEPFTRGTARGWIALGDVAYGVLLAVGGVATGGIALGAVAFGLCSIGAIAVGAMASGGLAVGGAANGFVALGHTSAGVLAAVGLDTAWGMIAIAKHAAFGTVFAAADHVGDAVARSALDAAEPWRRSHLSSPVFLFLPSLLIPVLSAIGTNWLIRSRKAGPTFASP